MKIKRKIILVLFLLTAFVFSATNVNKVDASSATVYTYALNSKGRITQTQDAYLPQKTITNLGIVKPSDIFIDHNNLVYVAVAESKNNKIIVLDPKNTSTIIKTITHSEFSDIDGIFVRENGDIYVADPGSNAIYVFDNDGNLLRKITMPTDKAYPSTKFQPSKVAVDKGGTIYVVLVGENLGLLKLANDGSYLGFFASNKVILNLRQRLEQLLYTKEKKKDSSWNVGSIFTNVVVDRDGIVYSTSDADNSEAIKKHNTKGNNMLSDILVIDENLTDIFVDKNGIIYVSDEHGWIDIYTSYGELIFTFGTTNATSIAGVFKKLDGIAVDASGVIWAIDAENNYIQTFVQTEYTQKVYKALSLYEEAHYKEAIVIWEEVLRLNQLSVLAHNGIAKNYLNLHNFRKAAEHFELAGNRTLYSEAYWEIRNTWLQNNLVLIIILILVLVMIGFIIKKTNKKHHYLDPVKNFLIKISKIKIADDVLYSFHVMKHPIDSMYYLKKKEKGSYLGATIILMLAFIAFIIFRTSKGFIFQTVSAKDMQLGSIALGFFVIVIAFAITNYLVTSIKDGEGGFGEIYKGICYSLMPLIIFALLATLLSYFMTLNEEFIYTLVWDIGLGWTLLLVWISIQEMQNYTFTETIVSVIVSFLFIAIIVIVLTFIEMIGFQIFNFIIDVIKEAIRNVFN